MNWYLADKNTWQGVITGHWPYNNIPQKLSGSFKKDFSNYFPIKLREDVWKYLDGQKDFNQCILQERQKFGEVNCDSIFHQVIYSKPLEIPNCNSSEAHYDTTRGLEKLIQTCLVQSDFKQYSTVSNEIITVPLIKNQYHGWDNKSFLEIGKN